MSNITAMTGISSLFIRRPVATSLLMAAILGVGLAAYPFLNVAPVPQVDFPTIQVFAQLPGASPETIAATVAQPLERQLAQVPGVTQMTSQSNLGGTNITIQFELDRNLDGAAQDVQSAITAATAQLPRTMPGPPRCQCGVDILYAAAVRSTLNDISPPHLLPMEDFRAVRDFDWHNGYFIAVLAKSPSPTT